MTWERMVSEIDKALQLANKLVKEGNSLRKLLIKHPRTKPSTKPKTKRADGGSPKPDLRRPKAR